VPVLAITGLVPVLQFAISDRNGAGSRNLRFRLLDWCRSCNLQFRIGTVPVSQFAISITGLVPVLQFAISDT
jgi:hypothetical protein